MCSPGRSVLGPLWSIAPASAGQDRDALVVVKATVVAHP
jgi:hypothetical protein